MATLEQLEELATRIVQLDLTLNYGRASTATVVGGQGPIRAGTGSAVDTRALGIPISFQSEDRMVRPLGGGLSFHDVSGMCMNPVAHRLSGGIQAQSVFDACLLLWGRPSTCDPHALGGAQCGEQRRRTSHIAHRTTTTVAATTNNTIGRGSVFSGEEPSLHSAEMNPALSRAGGPTQLPAIPPFVVNGAPTTEGTVTL